jgi:hypothetical protein
MSDVNTATIVETGPAGGGVGPWFVDGQIQMGGQWFFIELGDTVAPVEALGGIIEVGTDTNPFADPALDTLALRYGAGTTLNVDISLMLRGGLPGSGVADLAETIVISNLGPEALSLSFFQFVDFNLGGDPAGDTVEVLNPNTVNQQTAGVFGEEVATGTADPNVIQVGEIGEVLAAIMAGHLLHKPGPFIGTNSAFAIQWDIELAPGASFLISKDKTISVPEPATAGLLVLGLLVAGLHRRRASR